MGRWWIYGLVVRRWWRLVGWGDLLHRMAFFTFELMGWWLWLWLQRGLWLHRGLLWQRGLREVRRGDWRGEAHGRGLHHCCWGQQDAGWSESCCGKGESRPGLLRPCWNERPCWEERQSKVWKSWERQGTPWTLLYMWATWTYLPELPWPMVAATERLQLCERQGQDGYERQERFKGKEGLLHWVLPGLLHGELRARDQRAVPAGERGVAIHCIREGGDRHWCHWISGWSGLYVKAGWWWTLPVLRAPGWQTPFPVWKWPDAACCVEGEAGMSGTWRGFFLPTWSRSWQHTTTTWSTRSTSTTCLGVLQGRLAGAQDEGQMVGKFTRDFVEWTLGFGSTTTSRTSSSSAEAFAERPLQRVAWSRPRWSPWRWTLISWRWWRWRWKRSPSWQQASQRTSWAMQLWKFGWSCNPVGCLWRTSRSWSWRRTIACKCLTICKDRGIWLCELCGKPWCFGERWAERKSMPWWNHRPVFYADVTRTFGCCRCPCGTGISTCSCRGGGKRCGASTWSWSSTSVGWEHACTCTTWRHTSWSCCWITCSCRTPTWTSCSWKSPWRFTSMSTCFDGLEKWWKRSTAWNHGWATELSGSTLTTAEAEVFTSAPWNRSILRRSRILANWDGHVVECTRRAKRSPTSTQHGRAPHVAGYACAMWARRPTREIPELLDLLRTLWWRPSWSCRTTSSPGRWQKRSSMESWWRSRADT